MAFHSEKDYCVLRADILAAGELLAAKDCTVEYVAELIAPYFQQLLEYVEALESNLVEAVEVLEREDGGVPSDLYYFLRNNGIQ